MKKLFLLFALFGAVAFLHGKEKIDPMKLSAADFLKIVRHVPGQETWAKMEGSASHKREGARRIKAPIRLGIRFTPARIVAQMVFDSKEFLDNYVYDGDDLGAVINGDKINVIVKSDGLNAGQIAQINEIVYQQTGILPININIIEKSA